MFLARRLSRANLLTSRRTLLRPALLENPARGLKSMKVRAPLFFDVKSITFNPSKEPLLSAEYVKPRHTHKGKKRPQRVQVTWECEKCKRRHTEAVYKVAFEDGIVASKCDGCDEQNLLVDNLGVENVIREALKSMTSPLGVLDEKQDDDSAESSSCLSDDEDEQEDNCTEFWTSLFDGAEEN